MITIRTVATNEFDQIHQLIMELAVFEKESEAVTNTPSRLLKDYQQGLFKCQVALVGSLLVGMALYYDGYSSWAGKMLYLDDLYVKPDYRGQKIGSLLVNKIFEIAKNEDYQKVRWQVLDWNSPAIDFYHKCGALINYPTFQNCDFDIEKIRNFRIDL